MDARFQNKERSMIMVWAVISSLVTGGDVQGDEEGQKGEFVHFWSNFEQMCEIEHKE